MMVHYSREIIKRLAVNEIIKQLCVTSIDRQSAFE